MSQALRKAFLIALLFVSTSVLFAKSGDNGSTPYNIGYAVGKLTVYAAIIAVAVILIRKFKDK
jgi:uncharacterized membrane protein YkvI